MCPGVVIKRSGLKNRNKIIIVLLSLVNLNFGRDRTHVEMSGWLPFSNGGEVQSSVTVMSTVD